MFSEGTYWSWKIGCLENLDASCPQTPWNKGKPQLRKSTTKVSSSSRKTCYEIGTLFRSVISTSYLGRLWKRVRDHFFRDNPVWSHFCSKIFFAHVIVLQIFKKKKSLEYSNYFKTVNIKRGEGCLVTLLGHYLQKLFKKFSLSARFPRHPIFCFIFLEA